MFHVKHFILNGIVVC